jgi:hypothetical protein
MRPIWRPGFLIALAYLVAACTFAQTYEGRILGTITDQSGGAVRDAKVIITNVDTGVSRELVTNETGDYVAPNLTPGVYKVVVEVTGFKKMDRAGIRLEVAKDARLDLALQPGSLSETVNVTEDVPLIEVTNDTLGGTFANKSINDLPLNGRDFQNLVVLRPGVQRSPGGGFLSISSNGNRPEDNNFIVDGTDNNDPYYGTTVINAEGVQGTPGSILPIDAIQEFNAQENPPAEYGWKPGAIVNLGLKSGTNDLHGTAYYFGRNDHLDARNYFNTAPDPKRALRQHQFGASIGGPIIKSKTFFFGAYEGIRALVANSEILESPATAGFAGSDPANSIADAIASVTANAGAGRVSALSTSLAKLFPANTGTLNPNDHAALQIGFPNHNRNDNFVIKGDHHFNERHSISSRFFFGDSLQTERDIAVLRPEWQSQSQLRAQVVGINYNWIPNARWVNEAKFGYNRFWQSILTADHDKDPKTTYGINTRAGLRSIDFGMPEIAIGPFTSLGGNHGWPLLTTPNETYQFADNVSYLHGKHSFRFGGEFRHGHTHNIRDRYGKSRIRFTGTELSRLCGCLPGGRDSTPLEDFIAGLPRGAVSGRTGGRVFIGDSERDVTINSYGGFMQDDWRVTPRLTVNAGLRYDLNGVIHEANDRLANFDPATGIHQVGKGIGAPYNGDHNNFAPRLGIAWDARGNGKTVVRAGAGVIYEIPHLSIFLGQNGVNNASTPGLNVIPTDPASGIPGSNGNILATSNDFSGSTLNWTVAGPVFQPTVNCNATPCNILGAARNLRTPYVITWNVNVQQALTRTTSLQVGYVGNHGVKQYSVRDINQVVFAKDDGSEQLGRPFNAQYPYLGVINFLENGYTSIYHGLQTTLTQHTSHGLNFVAGYTWAHAIDFVSLNRAAQPQDSFNPAAERASGDQDIRHRLTLALSYDLPSRQNTYQLLEGWQVNSIVYFQTGAPWGLVDGFANGNDISLTGEFSDRWNIVGSPNNITWSTSGSVPFFDFTMPQTSPQACMAHANLAQLQSFGCFIANGTILVPPNAGSFGNLGRNTFRGPSQSNWDFSLVKNTRITERVNFQFRAEFFNVLNHPHFANPATPGNIDPSVPGTFGRSGLTPDIAAANPVIGTGGPRNIQLGLKFRF